jgi:hypothetical protein
MSVRWAFVFLAIASCGAGRTSMLPYEPGQESPEALADGGPRNASVDARILRDAVMDLRPIVDSPRIDTRLDTRSSNPSEPSPLPPPNPPPPPPDPPIVIDAGTDAVLILSPNACPSGASLTSCERQGLTCLIYTNGAVTGGCACLNFSRSLRWFCLQ